MEQAETLVIDIKDRNEIQHIDEPSRDSSTGETCTHEFSDSQIAEVNLKGVGLWKVDKAGDFGWGIFAQKDYAPNEFIFRGKALRFQQRDSHTVQVGWDKHALMDLPATLINHSCEANTGIKDNEYGAYDFFAVRPIKAGEQLTWDYGCAEFETLTVNDIFKECLCGSAKCRKGRIAFKVAKKDLEVLYGEYIANYLAGWA